MTLDDLKISHFFVGQHYAKLTEIDAGTTLTSHTHTFPHQSALLIGSVELRIGTQAPQRLQAPCTIEIPAGVAHEVKALEASLWACLWPNPQQHRDPADFDRSVIDAPVR